MAQETVTFDDSLAPVLARAKTEHGADVVNEVVENWLRGREEQQDRADFDEVKSGRASIAVRNRLKARLGL